MFIVLNSLAITVIFVCFFSILPLILVNKDYHKGDKGLNNTI